MCLGHSGEMSMRFYLATVAAAALALATRATGVLASSATTGSITP
jgi:hypothetical protein